MFTLVSTSASLSSNSIISTSPYSTRNQFPIIPQIPRTNSQLYPNPGKLPPKFTTFAQNNNNLNKDSNDAEKKGDDTIKNGRPRFNLKWVDLVLDPDPDNIVAVGLAGVLAWASVQVLWQLFFISLAILTAALKYSFIAALLVFILITLL